LGIVVGRKKGKKGKDMRIRNSTDFSVEKLREIIQVVRPPGISKFDVMVKNSRGSYAGRAYSAGSEYHDRDCPFIVVRIGKAEEFPKKNYYRFKKGAPDFWMLTREEGLVAVMAHELRHLYQAKARNRRGYFPKTRGKFSEVDADCYALNRLRAWRRR
jgi:hypothetical protein